VGNKLGTTTLLSCQVYSLLIASSFIGNGSLFYLIPFIEVDGFVRVEVK
jgi:hypothetical protein